MMKYRNLAILGIILLVIIGIAFSNLEFKEKRYHQHLDAKVRPEDVVTTDEFATHLPIIKIETEGKIPEPYIYEELKEGAEKDYSKNYVNKKVNGKTVTYKEEKNYDTVNATFEYIQNKDKENKENDTPVFKTNSKFRIRGRSSRKFEKKGYSVKFMNEDYTDKVDIEIDGMAADSDWVLHGPCMDKTLIRNYLCYNLAGEAFEVYSPNVRFCELFLNGSYEGLYLLVEEVNYNKEGRIEITKSDPDSKSTSFILKIDELSRKEDRNMKSYFYDTYRREGITNNRVSIRYPSKTLTEEQKKYIENRYYDIERTISSKKLFDKKEGYRKYINVDSFVDYFIFNEFVMNADVLKLSTFIYSDLKNDKIRTAVWDFNNSFENFLKNERGDSFIMSDAWWYKYLLKDTYFNQKIIKRYKKLRKSVLSDEYIEQYIDETIEYIAPAIERNYERWPNTMKTNFISEKERNKYTYEENVEYLKASIKDRAEFLDENIESIKYYSHKSNNK